MADEETIAHYMRQEFEAHVENNRVWLDDFLARAQEVSQSPLDVLGTDNCNRLYVLTASTTNRKDFVAAVADYVAAWTEQLVALRVMAGAIKAAMGATDE